MEKTISHILNGVWVDGFIIEENPWMTQDRFVQNKLTNTIFIPVGYMYHLFFGDGLTQKAIDNAGKYALISVHNFIKEKYG